MPRQVYRIPTYKIDEDVGFGFYDAAPELEEDMSEILDHFSRAPLQDVKIPYTQGAFIRGHRIGAGYEMVATISCANRFGAERSRQSAITVYLATDAASAREACRRALDAAASYGWQPEDMDPDWRRIMKNPPKTPFTIVIPNPAALEVIVKDQSAVKQLDFTTGFSQVVIAIALKRDGFETIPFIDGEASEEDDPFVDMADSGISMAAAIQTGGAPHDTLIVSPGTDEYPDIHAYIMDIELDVFRVDFHLDGTITIHADDMSYLTVREETLSPIQHLAQQAQAVWATALAILDEYEDQVEAGLDDAGEDGPSDPIAHLYTHGDYPADTSATTSGGLIFRVSGASKAAAVIR